MPKPWNVAVGDAMISIAQIKSTLVRKMSEKEKRRPFCSTSGCSRRIIQIVKVRWNIQVNPIVP